MKILHNLADETARLMAFDSITQDQRTPCRFCSIRM